MGESLLRIGKVSSVDYETGMMRVVYTDKGAAVTKEMPYMNFNDEYNMPKIGTRVLTAHLSNGNSRGVVIGPMWNRANKPAEAGKGIFRKEMSKTKGAAITRYDDDSGEYLLKAPNVRINGVNKTILEGPEVEIEASTSVKLNGKKMSASSKEAEFSSPKLKIGGEADGEEAVSEMEIENKCDIQFLSEEKKIEAIIKKIVLETIEEISVESGKKVSIKSSEDMEFEDGEWKTSLGKIMTRLAALDGDQSEKK